MKKIINSSEYEDNTPVVLFVDDEPLIIDLNLDADKEESETFRSVVKMTGCFVGAFLGTIVVGTALSEGVNIDKTDALLIGGTGVVGYNLIRNGYKALNMSRNIRNKGKELKLIKE